MPSIIDPIYGRVLLSELEQQIISTPEMARLRRIQQLGLADIAFPGANHTRFEHSVGTLFIANKMANFGANIKVYIKTIDIYTNRFLKIRNG